jgi:hypothetical protein
MKKQTSWKSTWLHELAGNIAYNYRPGSGGPITAEMLVEYALDKETLGDDGVDLPSWFDDDDRAELVRLVDSIL